MVASLASKKMCRYFPLLQTKNMFSIVSSGFISQRLAVELIIPDFNFQVASSKYGFAMSS